MRGISLAVAAVLVAMLAAPGTARAASVYLGPAIVGSQMSEDDGAFTAAGFDDLSSGFRFTGGSSVNRWADLEASIGPLAMYEDPDGDDLVYRGLVLSSLFHLRLGSSVSLYTRLGGGIMYIDENFDDDDSDKNDSKPLGVLGLGTELVISPALSMRMGVDNHYFSTNINASGAERFRQRLDVGYIGLMFQL